MSWGAALAQLHIAEQRKDNKKIAYYKIEVQKIEQENKMSELENKEAYIKSEYGYMYSSAVRKSTEENRILHFDTRYWTTKDIKEFFEDLQFVNPHVYECVKIKLSKTCHNMAAEKRYKKWKDNLLQ
jgi:hypothetical protein